MGNALRFLCGCFQWHTTTDEAQVLDSHGVTIEIVGVAALAMDLHHFGITSQVPTGLSQYVSSSKKEQASCITETRELKLMPLKVKDAIIIWENARAVKDFKQARLIKREIIAYGYRRVDAPEIGMTYGKEAKEVLVKMIQGKCLKIHVYNEDKYGRSVGDVYCNDIFIQEHLLKRGYVWHYVAYDRHPEFAKWQKEAAMVIEACGLYHILRNYGNGGKIIPIHMNTDEKPPFCLQFIIQ